MPAPTAHPTIDLLRNASPAAVDVFTRILTRGPISRIDIARLTGLSQAAVTKAVAPLIAAGIVTDHHEQPKGGLPGRPATLLRIVAQSLVTIGVKVNEDDIIGVATDLTATILASTHRSIGDGSFKSVLDDIVVVVEELKELLGDRIDRLAGVGVAVSGDVDSLRGIVRESALLGWAREPLGTALRERLDLDVLVENDVRALTIAEHWFGVGVGTASFAIVTIGSGIGCGLHVNGEVVEGAYGVAGEIGHLPLTSSDRICTCGRRGCVETVASSHAIVGAASGPDRQGLSVQDVVDLAHAGDSRAVEAFDQAGTVIGTAIATMVNLAGPELVLISGEAVADYDLYDTHLRAAFAEHAFGAAAGCRIVVRPNTFDDWARGAAASVIRAIVTQRYPVPRKL
ncbi:MAG: sugar kinase [Microbacteriaceae bacterium]|nr:sugar kinase [Microbacteriaceae bacterium]